LVKPGTLNPQPNKPATNFNLSVEMDCLRYCAKTNKDYTKSAFSLKDPIHLTLSVTNQVKITVSATPPDVLSITGLKANIALTRAGNLTMTLHSLEYCDKLTVFLNTKRSISMEKAYYFLQTINNTEYIYIEGEPKEKNSRRRFYRLPMDEIEHIECVLDTNSPAMKPPGCNCPVE